MIPWVQSMLEVWERLLYGVSDRLARLGWDEVAEPDDVDDLVSDGCGTASRQASSLAANAFRSGTAR
jgi:hypothetical protein